MLFRAAVLGLAAVAAAANITPRDPTRHCLVSRERGPAKLDPEEPAAARRASDEDNEPEIEVDVYFHVVAASKDADDGYVTVR